MEREDGMRKTAESRRPKEPEMRRRRSKLKSTKPSPIN